MILTFSVMMIMRLRALALSTASGIMYCVVITLEHLSGCSKYAALPIFLAFE
jgi:hypothetical protein